MTLDEYLKNPATITAAELARRIGCHKGYITRLRDGDRTPSMSIAAKIEAETNGKVKVSIWTKRAA